MKIYKDDPQTNLLNIAVSITGEAAELLDAVVKYVDGERLDVDSCIEKLGGLEFYMEGFRDAICFTRKDILDAYAVKWAKDDDDEVVE